MTNIWNTQCVLCKLYLVVLPIGAQQKDEHPAIRRVFQQQLTRTATLREGGREWTKNREHSGNQTVIKFNGLYLNTQFWRITLWAKLLKRLKYCAQFFTFSGTSLSSKESRASVKLSSPGSPNWSALSRVFSRMDATTTLTSLTLHSNRQTLRKCQNHQYQHSSEGK